MPEDTFGIQECEHRKDVQVRFGDGRVFCGPSGTRLEAFVDMLQRKRHALARV